MSAISTFSKTSAYWISPSKGAIKLSLEYIDSFPSFAESKYSFKFLLAIACDILFAWPNNSVLASIVRFG